MSQTTLPDNLRELSIDERMQLIEALWDSITAEQEALEVTDAQKAELDRRLEAHAASPSGGMPWDELRDRLSRSP
jgi:putative addiction module component (TIGR02574 family)